MCSDRAGAAGWRSVPSELGVPTAMATVLCLVAPAVPAEGGRASVWFASVMTGYLLVAHGLLVLRRRCGPRASALLAVGAVLQAVSAATALASSLVPAVLDPSEQLAAWEAAGYVASVVAVGFAIAMITVARAWRSLLAPIALLTSLAGRLPPPLGALVRSLMSSRWQLQLFFVLTTLAAQLALLAVFARLAVPAARADLAGAERGARRAARWLRVRGVVMLVHVTAIGVLVALEGFEWFTPLALVLGLAALVAAGGQVAGLLAMATASVAGMPPGQLRVAAFGALWEGLLIVMLRTFGFAGNVQVAIIGDLLVGAVGVAVGANAMRALAIHRGDTPLANAITGRVSVAVLLYLLSLCGIVAMERGTEIGMMIELVCGVLQASAMIVLAGVYRRVAVRMQMAEAVDVF